MIFRDCGVMSVGCVGQYTHEEYYHNKSTVTLAESERSQRKRRRGHRGRRGEHGLWVVCSSQGWSQLFLGKNQMEVLRINFGMVANQSVSYLVDNM